MSKLEWLTKEIDGLKEQGLYNNIRTIGSAQGARLMVDGKDVLNFCSNNYLGLANHPKLVEAAREATKKYGVGPGADGFPAPLHLLGGGIVGRSPEGARQQVFLGPAKKASRSA